MSVQVSDLSFPLLFCTNTDESQLNYAVKDMYNNWITQALIIHICLLLLFFDSKCILSFSYVHFLNSNKNNIHYHFVHSVTINIVLHNVGNCKSKPNNRGAE